MIKTNNTRALKRKMPVRIPVDNDSTFLEMIQKSLTSAMVSSTSSTKAYKVRLKSIVFEQTKVAEDNNNHTVVFFGREYDLKATSLGNRIVIYKPDEDSLEDLGQYVHYDHTLTNEGESSQADLIDSHVIAFHTGATNYEVFANFEVIELLQKS